MSHTCNHYCIPSDQIHCSLVYLTTEDSSHDIGLLAQDMIAVAPATEAPTWAEYLRQRYHLPVASTIQGDPEPFLMYWRREE